MHGLDFQINPSSQTYKTFERHQKLHREILPDSQWWFVRIWASLLRQVYVVCID